MEVVVKINQKLFNNCSVWRIGIAIKLTNGKVYPIEQNDIFISNGCLVKPFNFIGNCKKAFLYSFGSGLVEPLGAIVGYFLLATYLTPFVMGMLMAGVAGIMVFISLDQLLPAAHEYDDHRLSIYGVVCGMFLMAVSLNILVSHHAHVH